MKSLLCVMLFTIASTNIFAAGATAALRAVIAPGEYAGSNLDGRCLVKIDVANYPRLALNTLIISNNMSLSKLVDDEAVFATKGTTKSFYQSDRTYIHGDAGDYIEKYIRTFRVSDKSLRIAVGEVYVIQSSLDEEFTYCDLAL